MKSWWVNRPAATQVRRVALDATTQLPGTIQRSGGSATRWPGRPPMKRCRSALISLSGRRPGTMIVALLAPPTAGSAFPDGGKHLCWLMRQVCAHAVPCLGVVARMRSLHRHRLLSPGIVAAVASANGCSSSSACVQPAAICCERWPAQDWRALGQTSRRSPSAMHATRSGPWGNVSRSGRTHLLHGRPGQAGTASRPASGARDLP